MDNGKGPLLTKLTLLTLYCSVVYVKPSLLINTRHVTRLPIFERSK
jgi:hypothetical protein